MENRDKIINIDISKEMKKSYIDYAMSVIVSRALPDVRDGLKPVHRRILYSMNENNFTPEKPHRKSARIVGDVLGKYHPHGDSSVYNAMVRMAQEFSIRHPLIDGHGNFGSIDGDSAAAMRYTEARMTKLATEMLRDIEKNTVDYTMNFDETLKEPVVLPSRFPNLLVNGSNGIAVGMATSIPPHNLGEIIDGTIRLIDFPDSNVEDLIEIVKGPDFPTGATIMGMESFKKAYRTGKGSAVVRSKIDIEEIRKNKMAIIVTEIPYQVNKSKLLENIADLVKNKKIDGITDLRDESDRNGIRVVIELRKDANANVILNKLYKHTQLQSTYSMNLIALVDGVPKLLNLYQILYYYLEHQKDVETRRVNFDLNKAEARSHILEGLIIALSNIDEIIKLIRGSNSTAEAKKSLIERFELSEIQAQAILDMRLQKLTGLERGKIESEHKELQKLISHLIEIIQDEKLLLAIIKEDLIRIKNKFNDERRTKVEFMMDEIDLEDLIEEDEVVVTLTHKGYIKRVSLKEYSSQKRGGRGKAGMITKDEDFLEHIYTTSTHDYILFFTNLGKVYRLKGYNIPDGSRISKGTAVVNLLELDSDEIVTSIIPIKDFEKGYLMLCTKNGIVKKTLLNKYDTSRKSGLIAVNLKENDELISVKVTDGNDEIMIVTEKGKSIRFKESDVREMGRTATGVIGIRLDNSDKVVMLEKIKEESKLLVVSKNGYGKRTKLKEYKVQSRGGKGIKTYNVSAKTGNLIGALIVNEDDELIIINNNGILIRIIVSEISVSGRATSGVTLMRTDKENYVVSIAKVIEEEEEEIEIKIEE
ncbi:DNA gyrase subunit A [Helicovermis profundi]|uniref:DNA gyrase subunit A n=1 Tax=Helicovermis profundi TaxID=3065157 RepID=A0AAU9E1H8_9FIRM|nr:DNA gyrase subunit A [Clostridia bacterium S502]